MTFFFILGNYFLDFLEWLFREFEGDREYHARVAREQMGL